MSAPRPAGSQDRRSSKRKKVRGKVKLECRKGTMGLGANLALEVWDLSQTGACLIVRPGIAKGDEVEVILSSTTLFRPIKCVGAVVWAMQLSPDRSSIGVQFQKQIPYADLNNLT